METLGDSVYSEEEIIEFVNKNKPQSNSNLSVTKMIDKNGWVYITLICNKNEFRIKYSSCMMDTSILIKFFAKTVNLKSDLALFLDNEGSEPLLYVKIWDENNIRFLFAHDYELFNKFCKDEINDYGLKDYESECDIIINKRILLTNFYNILQSFITNYDIEDDYFKTFNIEKGHKDLNKIREYLINKNGWIDIPI